MSVKQLKEILDQIDFIPNLDIVDGPWVMEDNEYRWIDGDDLEDFEEGEFYSIEPRGGIKEYDGYLLVNGDNGCGDVITYFFNKRKEVKL